MQLAHRDAVQDPRRTGSPPVCQEPATPSRGRLRWRWCPLLFLLALGPVPPGSAEEEQTDLEKILEVSLADLMNLRVETVLKQPISINEVPATVRVITAAQIEERGYLTLEDALADLPGFQFRNIEGFNSYVFLRGVPSQNNKILILIDGIQVNELNSGGFYGGGQFNLTQIQRIEVVYGPASSLYGTNAVSGLINLITRAPGEARGGQVGLSAGSHDTQLVDFRLGGSAPNRQRGFALSGMYKHSDKADLRGHEGDGNWTDRIDASETDLALDGRVRLGSLDAGLSIQDKDASRATTQRTSDTSLSDHGVNWHIRFVNGWATYNYDRQKSWSLRSTAYLRDSTVLRDTVPSIELATAESPGWQQRTYRPGRLVGSETRVLWTPAPHWNVSVGVVLEHEKLAERFATTQSASASEYPPSPPDPPSLTNDLVSVYAQAQIPLVKMLDAFVGLRLDDSSYYGTVNTPRLGLVFNRKKLTARALFVEAFRAPKPWDFTDGVGNPELEPETMRSYELSGAWLASSHLRLELSTYRNKLRGLLTRMDEGADWHWINAGRVDTTGLEATVEYRRKAVRSFITYSYTDSEDENGSRVPEIASHGATAGLSYAVSRTLTTGLRCRYLGSRLNPTVIPTTGDDQIEGAFVSDVNASMKLARKLTLRLFVDNVTNEAYFHPSNLPPSRYRQPQRGVRLKVEYAY